MKTYDEALRIWASRRFDIPLDEIDSVEVNAVAAGEEIDRLGWEHGGTRVLLYPVDGPCEWDLSGRHPRRITEWLTDPLPAVIYGVVVAGMEADR